MPRPDPVLAHEQYCYLTTRGRVSGEPRQIEIWFALVDSTVYVLSGGRDRSNWVRNLLVEPHVYVRISERVFSGLARIVEDAEEDALVRRLLLEKYSAGYSGDLTEWGRDSLPVAVELGA